MRNSAPRNNNYTTLTDFLRTQPPQFSFAKEPLEADDWLRAMERKFAALHVPEAEHVNFATYLLSGSAGAWWESHMSMSAAGHVFTWAEFRTAFLLRSMSAFGIKAAPKAVRNSAQVKTWPAAEIDRWLSHQAPAEPDSK